MSRSALRLAVVVLITLAAACDKVALLAPTGSTVTLSISSTSVASNGTAEVVATVIEAGGTPVHNGTEVTFQASVGRIDPAVVRTEGGIARTTFHANGASGTARITAFSGGARATDVEVLVGSAAASTVTVRTNPASVPQSGGSVEVVANVRDASGNPLPGAQVVFSADNGTLSSNSAVTNAQGDATTTLTTTRQTVVRASVAGKEGQATVAVVSAPNVELTASTTTPNVGVPVTFTIRPATGTTGNPLQNVVFDPGDGSPVRNLGAINNSQTIQHTYQRADTYTAKAIATDTSGQRGESTVVLSVGRTAPTVTISASPNPATVGELVTFTVTSTPAANGPPVASVTVIFPDGGSQNVGPGTQSVTRSFSSPGSYTIRARVTDTAGTTNENVTALVVRPLEVNVDATAVEQGWTTSCQPANSYPKTCTITPFLGAGFNVRVQLSATLSPTDPGARFAWNFGDGTSEVSGRTTDHVFARFNTYTVTATAQTATGATVSGRITLVIQ